MINKTKVIFFFLILININNYTLAENNFFEEGKKMYNKKNMKSQNFYFREVQFLILKIKIPIYTQLKFINFKKIAMKNKKILTQFFY